MHYFYTVVNNLASIKFTYLPEKKKFQFRNYFPDRSCDSIFMDTAINNSVLNVQKSFLYNISSVSYFFEC